MADHACAYSALLKWTLTIIGVLGAFIAYQWDCARKDAADQREVDKAQTEASLALAKQSERVEAMLQTVLSMVANARTANPGGGSVEQP
jgi:hypothetical protein